MGFVLDTWEVRSYVIIQGLSSLECLKKFVVISHISSPSTYKCSLICQYAQKERIDNMSSLLYKPYTKQRWYSLLKFM